MIGRILQKLDALAEAQREVARTNREIVAAVMAVAQGQTEVALKLAQVLQDSYAHAGQPALREVEGEQFTWVFPADQPES